MNLMVGIYIASAILFVIGVGYAAWKYIDKFFNTWGN